MHSNPPARLLLGRMVGFRDVPFVTYRVEASAVLGKQHGASNDRRQRQ